MTERDQRGESRDPADLLLEDPRRVLPRLDKQGEPHRDAEDAGGFAHRAVTRNPRRPGRR